jgi:hypothetical protein
MVSIDHFAHELRTQLKRAAEQGATNILIRASELCRSVRMGSSSMDACCDAMQNEIKPGDVVVLHRNSGAGMTVRYLLPRLAANEVSISATCARKITGQSCAGDHALRLGTPRRGEVRVPTDGADGPPEAALPVLKLCRSICR